MVDPLNFKPSRLPVDFPIPTHMTTEEFNRTIISDATGKFAIYFSPLTGAWEAIRRGF